MSKEMRKQINKVKNFGQSLNENTEIKAHKNEHINFRDINYEIVNKIYKVINNENFNFDHNIIKNSNILMGGISLKQEEILYNTNLEYKKLYDKDYVDMITDEERKRMSNIYMSEVKKEQSKYITYYYEKYKKENINHDYIKWVESII